MVFSSNKKNSLITDQGLLYAKNSFVVEVTFDTYIWMWLSIVTELYGIRDLNHRKDLIQGPFILTFTESSAENVSLALPTQ